MSTKSGPPHGTDINGTARIDNLYGIIINGAPNNLIGGTIAGARNVISGNSRGIYIVGNTATSNLIQGNLIGTNAMGSAALSNSFGYTSKMPLEI